ncbi:MAG: glycosyl hydrolase family 18 protein [Capsulimonas sp.]|uniref:glycosyl hydrolase family 18 protein n=1 Tax=Capsulimonas sp. TaxID=2494211 RepID=UPI003265214E
MNIKNFAFTLVLLGSVVPAANAAPVVLGYYTANADADTSVKNFGGSFNQVSTDTFKVAANGSISGDVPVQALAAAKSRKMKTYVCLANFGAVGFDSAIAHSVITDAAATSRLIADTLALIRANGYTGVNLDIEGVPSADRAAFTAFVHQVSSSMRQAGFKTVISVPTQTKDDPTNSWSGAFDLRSIGRDVDIVQYMAYDQHGPWSGRGAVASIDWVTDTTKYALSIMPASKINLGLAAYGYDWNLTKKTCIDVSWKDIPALIETTKATPLRDPASGSPHFEYVKDGDNHVIWYEDATSIRQKAKLAASRKLNGVSVWALGKEDPSFWQAVKSGLSGK